MAVFENLNKAMMVEESERHLDVLRVIAFGRNGKNELGCLAILCLFRHSRLCDRRCNHLISSIFRRSGASGDSIATAPRLQQTSQLANLKSSLLLPLSVVVA